LYQCATKNHVYTTLPCDTITVMWKMRHFRHFTSEHYKVSKTEVFEKLIRAAEF